MTSIKTLTALAAGALSLSAGSAALAQTPYNQTPYNQSPYGQTSPYGSSQTNPLGAILGALFGDRLGVSTTLDSEWSRGRRPLNAQRAQIEARIDADLRSGDLSSSAANGLRGEYSDLVQLESRYTADGRVTTQERADLSERYRAFSTRYQAGGSDYGDDNQQWTGLADGRADFDARLEAQIRNRSLTRTEANRIRSDYAALIQVENSYQRDGISAREQADLQTRLDDLNRRVGDNYDGGYGTGTGGYGSTPYARQIASIESSIASGERSGYIPRAETERLRTELGDLTRLDAAYRENGLNADESAYLTRRFGELDARVRVRR